VTLARDLLAWYDRHQRELPWREAPDPYRTWVSEIMLQQTRVETVRDRFLRFLSVFPTSRHSRRRRSTTCFANGQGSATTRAHGISMRRQGRAERGAFPDTVAELEGAPGIGRYTAGAIASIAFGVDAPAIDGNAVRVLSRVYRTRARPPDSRGCAPKRYLRAGRASSIRQ
jgi:A/G-specific adenine glycosylase